MTETNPDRHEDTPLEAPLEGAIAPELLRLIQRVAHREHLLDGVPTVGSRPRTTAQRSSARRRPVIGTAPSASAVRVTRGTTARKVTWS